VHVNLFTRYWSLICLCSVQLCIVTVSVLPIAICITMWYVSGLWPFIANKSSSIYNVSPKSWFTFRDLWLRNCWDPFAYCDPPFGGHYVATIIGAICLVLYFFLSFFRRLIFKVTERISTSIYPRGLGAKKPLLGNRLWTLTEHISARNMISKIGRKLVNLQGLPNISPDLVNFGPETAENGWRVFAHP